MGGVPLLLMAVAMGITYGWHPDGAGGVNYIIQIPPEQLDAVRRSGEISSVIDPEVRGHVSRVIIRVGTDPLPKETPANLRADRRSYGGVVQASANDHSHIESPNLVARSQTPNVVMKPQTGEVGGMSLPPTLAQAAAEAGTAASQAGSGLHDGMTELSAELARRQRSAQGQTAKSGGGSAGGIDDLMRSALGGGSGTATANGQGANPRTGTNRATPPPFTGGGNTAPVARVRTGGPTTAPANTRDKTWFQMNTQTAGASTDPVNTKAPWPGNMVGPPDPRKNQVPAGSMTNTNRERAQPIGSTTNFAHVPGGGIGLPNNAGTNTGPAQTANMTAQEQAEYLRRLRLQQTNQNPRGTEQNTTNHLGSITRNPGGENVARNRSLQSATQQFANRTNATTNAQDIQRLQFDPRLSQAEIAQLPYGAWSIDQYGNPTDRDGRILDEYGRLVSQQRAYELTLGRVNATATLEQPFPDLRSSASSTPMQKRFAPVGYDDRFDRIAQRNRVDEYNRSVQRSSGPATGLPPQTRTPTVSPSDREPSDYRSVGTTQPPSADELVPAKRRTTLAAQPMFNGLLLMSIVANVYLIFWLKNLRHQFHDLVASKRATGSELSA